MSTTIAELKENTENFRPLQVKGNVREVNLPRADKSGAMYQIIYIEDGTGDLKVKIKDERLFTHNDHGKSELIIRASKGNKNVPVGLLYLPEKEMLTVSEGSELIEVKPEIKAEVKAEKEQEQVTVKPQLTEIPSTVKQVLEMKGGHFDYDLTGPSDEVIREEFLERAHIFQLVNRFNAEIGMVFPSEALLPMTTSILIDARRAGAKILNHKSPASQLEAKKNVRQENVKEAAITPAPSEVKATPEPSALSKTELLISEISKHSGTEFFNAPDFDGNGTIGKSFLDNARRPLMVKWAYSKAKTKLPEAKKVLRDNIFSLIRLLTRVESITLVQEAMMHDVADDNGFLFDFDKENKFFNRVDAKTNSIVASMKLENFNPHEAAIRFFTEDFDKKLEPTDKKK